MPLTPMIRDLLDRNGGKLPAHAWPGGYPIVYHVLENGHHTGEVVCPDCANMAVTEECSWSVWGYETFMEGPVEQCTNCNKEIESAYGDPDEEEDKPPKCTRCGDGGCPMCDPKFFG